MLDVHHPRSFALPLGLAVELRVQVGGHQQHDRIQPRPRPDRGRLVGVTAPDRGAPAAAARLPPAEPARLPIPPQRQHASAPAPAQPSSASDHGAQPRLVGDLHAPEVRIDPRRGGPVTGERHGCRPGVDAEIRALKVERDREILHAAVNDGCPAGRGGRGEGKEQEKGWGFHGGSGVRGRCSPARGRSGPSSHPGSRGTAR